MGCIRDTKGNTIMALLTICAVCYILPVLAVVANHEYGKAHPSR